MCDSEAEKMKVGTEVRSCEMWYLDDVPVRSRKPIMCNIQLQLAQDEAAVQRKMLIFS